MIAQSKTACLIMEILSRCLLHFQNWGASEIPRIDSQ